jgi:predicted nucleotidyltransferase
VAPDAPIGVFEYVDITQYLADLFPNRVDVANRSSLKALVRPSAERDAVYAF